MGNRPLTAGGETTFELIDHYLLFWGRFFHCRLNLLLVQRLSVHVVRFWLSLWGSLLQYASLLGHASVRL